MSEGGQIGIGACVVGCCGCSHSSYFLHLTSFDKYRVSLVWASAGLGHFFMGVFVLFMCLCMYS